MIKNATRARYVSRSFVRDSEESRRHRGLISELAGAYHRSGFKVKADHVPDFESPEKISMIFPDIIAVKNGKKIVVEVETRSSRGSERDKRQQKVFGNWAKKDRRRDFRRELTI